MMLSPPRWKKEAPTPTSPTPSTAANRRHRVFSRDPSGRSSGRADEKSGAGSALRSTLPFGVSGSSSTATMAAGRGNQRNKPLVEDINLDVRDRAADRRDLTADQRPTRGGRDSPLSGPVD